MNVVYYIKTFYWQPVHNFLLLWVMDKKTRSRGLWKPNGRGISLVSKSLWHIQHHVDILDPAAKWLSLLQHISFSVEMCIEQLPSVPSNLLWGVFSEAFGGMSKRTSVRSGEKNQLKRVEKREKVGVGPCGRAWFDVWCTGGSCVLCLLPRWRKLIHSLPLTSLLSFFTLSPSLCFSPAALSPAWLCFQSIVLPRPWSGHATHLPRRAISFLKHHTHTHKLGCLC